MEAERGRIAVVGAGPAGAMAAFLLATRNHPVLLIDDARPSPDRIEMLPPHAAMAFRAGGLGPALQDPAIAVPCLGIVRRGTTEVRQDFLSQPGGQGLAIYRPAFNAAITAAAATAGAILQSGRLIGVEDHDTHFTLDIKTASDPERVDAAIIIDASGRSASAGRRLGAKIVTTQRLIAERIDPQGPADPWLHFSSDGDGWHYSISGPNQRRDAWRIEPSHHRRSGTTFVDASSRTLSPTAGRRWIAIGDAATAFDPICSQGLANAAGSALAAVGLILQSGTVEWQAAAAYDFACRETAASTESERQRVYDEMRRSAVSRQTASQPAGL